MDKLTLLATLAVTPFPLVLVPSYCTSKDDDPDRYCFNSWCRACIEEVVCGGDSVWHEFEAEDGEEVRADITTADAIADMQVVDGRRYWDRFCFRCQEARWQ